MPKLVALDAGRGQAFVDDLLRVWDAGDAVLPVDPRLPAPARQSLLTAVGVGTPVADGDALVMATSGTTGTPKGVVLTHDAIAASARATSHRLAVDPHHDRWLACLPLAHVGGLAVVTRALLTGTPVTVHAGFDAAAVSDAAEHGCNLVSLVNTALRRVDPALFRVIVLGGSTPPDDPPPNAVSTYGMTETGSGLVYDGVPLDGVEVRIEHDEIWVRGPMLLRCYRTDGGVETDPKSADGWFATGDSGSFTEDGRLRVYGRIGDVIVTGAEKVWPDAVEAVLRRHPAVADVAVAGRPDPEWGQRVVAFVVPGAGEAPFLDDLRAVVKESMPAYCAPRQLVLVEALPRTALGKVQRAEL